MDKKGQGLSLNVIIIAALALIVLVVLVVIFTGRIGVFEAGVSKEGQAELVQLKLSYGKCRPTTSLESSFLRSITEADKSSSREDQDRLKEEARSSFKDEIDRCAAEESDRASCESQDCRWA